MSIYQCLRLKPYLSHLSRVFFLSKGTIVVKKSYYVNTVFHKETSNFYIYNNKITSSVDV